GDIAPFIGSQEGDGFGDLVRISHPSQWNSFRKLLFHSCERLALLQAFHDWSIDVAGTDGVHANATLTQFVGPGTRERPNGVLSGAVDAHSWKSLGCCNRCIQDD